MSFVIDAMQHLGIYYTPLNLQYGAGKTRTVGDWASVPGNPPFGYKHVRRLISVQCPSCMGVGLDGQAMCRQCNGSGNIEVWVNEIVHSEE